RCLVNSEKSMARPVASQEHPVQKQDASLLWRIHVRERLAFLLIGTLAVAAPAGPSSAPAEFSHVVVRGEAIPLTQLFEQISNSTGVEFVVNDQQFWIELGRAQPVAAAIEGSFWPAMQQACELAKVTVSENSAGEILLGGGG